MKKAKLLPIKIIQQKVGTADWFPVIELFVNKGKLQDKLRMLESYYCKESPFKLKCRIKKIPFDLAIYNKNLKIMIDGLGGLPETTLKTILTIQKERFGNKINLLEGFKI